jgi:hypothetical protein
MSFMSLALASCPALLNRRRLRKRAVLVKCYLLVA